MRFEERYSLRSNAIFLMEVEINPSKDDHNVTEITLWWESNKDISYTYVPNNTIKIGYGIAVEEESMRVIGHDIPSIIDEIHHMIKTHLNEYIDMLDTRITLRHDMYFETVEKHLTAILKHIL